VCLSTSAQAAPQTMPMLMLPTQTPAIFARQVIELTRDMPDPPGAIIPLNESYATIAAASLTTDSPNTRVNVMEGTPSCVKTDTVAMLSTAESEFAKRSDSSSESGTVSARSLRTYSAHVMSTVHASVPRMPRKKITPMLLKKTCAFMLYPVVTMEA